MKVKVRQRQGSAGLGSSGLGSSGFSLTELMVAIGITATALLPVVALLATSTRAQLSASDRMTSMRIADAVFGEISSSLGAGAPGVILLNEGADVAGGEGDGDDVGGYVETGVFIPVVERPVYLLYAGDGRLLQQLDEQVFEAGYVAPAGSSGKDAGVGVALVRVEFLPVAESVAASAAGVSEVRVDVQYPADAALDSRRKDVFESLLQLSTLVIER